MSMFDPISIDVISWYAVSPQHHPKQYEYVIISKADGTTTVGYWLDSLEGYVEAVDPFEEWIEDAEFWAQFPKDPFRFHFPFNPTGGIEDEP